MENHGRANILAQYASCVLILSGSKRGRAGRNGVSGRRDLPVCYTSSFYFFACSNIAALLMPGFVAGLGSQHKVALCPVPVTTVSYRKIISIVT
jgi:hypothetical protein